MEIPHCTSRVNRFLSKSESIICVDLSHSSRPKMVRIDHSTECILQKEVTMDPPLWDKGTMSALAIGSAFPRYAPVLHVGNCTETC